MTKVLDVTGERCPIPALKAQKALKELKEGETLTVLATDPQSVADFEILCSNLGVKLKHEQLDNGVFQFILEKSK